jgi:hypothetical protein
MNTDLTEFKKGDLVEFNIIGVNTFAFVKTKGIIVSDIYQIRTEDNQVMDCIKVFSFECQRVLVRRIKQIKKIRSKNEKL